MAEEEQSRRSGRYLPPHRLRALGAAAAEEASAVALQRQKWETLERSLIGIVNRTNEDNLDRVVFALLGQNLLWGKGLLVRAITRSQAASPLFTPVYAALTCVLNSKLPEIGELLLARVLQRFQRAFASSDRLGCRGAARFLAQLLNQRVVEEFLGLQLLVFLLERMSEDAVELACEFLCETGQELGAAAPAGLALVFDRLKTIVQEGELGRKTQFVIEQAFAARRNGFADFPALPPALDLIAEVDKVTHRLRLEAEPDVQEALDRFRYDEHLPACEEEWRQIQREIVGEAPPVEEPAPAPSPPREPDPADARRLREGIYLRIMNSVEHEEAAHKLLKMALPDAQLEQLGAMVVDCCAEERSFLTYYGLLGVRLCAADRRLPQVFFKVFVDRYAQLHELDTQKLRKTAKFFAFLFAADAVDWHALACVRLCEEETTSSSRIFLKVLLQELAHQLGVEGLSARLLDADNAQAVAGLLPREQPEQLAFALNFFAAVGLRAAVEPLRRLLE